MIEVVKTAAFRRWLDGLRDARAFAKVTTRIMRMRDGNFGDVRPVGKGVSEMRIDYGPGYRVYFVQRGSALVILLGGGTKGGQSRDIAAAKRLASELE
ncbi:MAG: type II toxin-antitoxin system RelE/ParE family toxin [Sphingomonadaceae bacterium]|nr:type II toxin-antitoxin system RelE/ParE family toxin [Sphingomonadaceae bacterium]